MGSSIFVFNNSGELRQDRIKKILGLETLRENADVRVTNINKDTTSKKSRSIGIKEIKEGSNFIKERPYSGDSKVWMILDAELLTVPAQNALLKTLEEPPSYATIVLSAKSERSLLETVVSRCKKISVREENAENIAEGLEKEKSGKDEQLSYQIFGMPTGEKLVQMKELAKENREDVVAQLEYWIRKLRKGLETEEPTYSPNDLEILLSVKEDMESTNINVGLALDYLGVNIES
jgi:hypothetical protein